MYLYILLFAFLSNNARATELMDVFRLTKSRAAETQEERDRRKAEYKASWFKAMDYEYTGKLNEKNFEGFYSLYTQSGGLLYAYPEKARIPEFKTLAAQYEKVQEILKRQFKEYSTREGFLRLGDHETGARRSEEEIAAELSELRTKHRYELREYAWLRKFLNYSQSLQNGETVAALPPERLERLGAVRVDPAEYRRLRSAGVHVGGN
jgi:hypothetical protein